MNRCLISSLFITFIALNCLAQKNCPFKKNCQYMGSFIVTPKGHQRLFEISFKQLKSRINSEITDNFVGEVARQDIVLYETPEECHTETAKTQIEKFFIKDNTPTETDSHSSNCFFYPIISDSEALGKDIELIPVKISIKNTKVHNFDFDVDPPKCNSYNCSLKSYLKDLQFTGDIIIQNLDPNADEQRILERPSVMINVAKGGAVIDTVIALNENDNLHLLKGGIKNIQLDASFSTITPIILDPHTGKIITSKQKRHYLRTSAQEQRAKSMEEHFGFHPCKVPSDQEKREEEFLESEISELLDKESAQGLNDQKLDELGDNIITSYKKWKKERAQGVDCLDNQSSLPKKLFNDFGYQKTLDQCPDFRCYTKFLPYGKKATQKAALNLEGFSNDTSKKMFQHITHTINTEILKDPALNKHFEELVKLRAPMINQHIKTILQKTNQALNKSVLNENFNTQIPTTDFAEQLRLTRLNNLIEETKKEIHSLENSSRFLSRENEEDHLREIVENNHDSLNNKLKDLIQKKQDLKESLDSEEEDETQVGLKAIFEQTDKFNRYGVFNSKSGQCKISDKKLSDNGLVINDEELSQADFVLDVPISTADVYLQDIWKKNKEVCLSGIEENCPERSLHIIQSPELVWNEASKSHDVLIRGAQAKDLSFFVKDQTADIKFSTTFDKCSNNQKICLHLSKPQIKRTTDTGWKNYLGLGIPELILNSKIRSAEKGLNEIFKKPIGLNISPSLLHDSIEYKKPIIKERGLVIPIHLKDLPVEIFETVDSK